MISYKKYKHQLRSLDGANCLKCCRLSPDINTIHGYNFGIKWPPFTRGINHIGLANVWNFSMFLSCSKCNGFISYLFPDTKWWYPWNQSCLPVYVRFIKSNRTESPKERIKEVSERESIRWKCMTHHDEQSDRVIPSMSVATYSQWIIQSWYIGWVVHQRLLMSARTCDALS